MSRSLGGLAALVALVVTACGRGGGSASTGMLADSDSAAVADRTPVQGDSPLPLPEESTGAGMLADDDSSKAGSPVRADSARPVPIPGERPERQRPISKAP